MSPWFRLGLPLGLAVICMADPITFSLGGSSAYAGSATSTPSISGTAIVYSQSDPTGTGIPKGGIDVYFSPDLQTKLTETMKSKCKTMDNECYDSVKNIIMSPSTDIQARGLGLLGFGSALVTLVSAILIGAHKDTQSIPVPLNLPSAQLSQASAGISATAIAIATGSSARPYITIPQKPEPTTLTGTRPTVTTYTEAADGHAKGDVVITMPTNLASRMEEIIRRSSDATCPNGIAFNQKLRKRTFDFGSVICASQEVIINAQPGAALADYLVIHPGALAWAAPDAVRAMNTVMQFARDYAGLLQVDTQTAASIGVGVFAAAWEVLANNKPLAAVNVIPASALTTATSTSCPEVTSEACLVNCRMIGVIKRCATKCAKETHCKTSGSTSNSFSISTTTTVPWTAPPATTTASPSPTFHCVHYGDSSGKSGCYCPDGGPLYKPVTTGNNPCPYTTVPPDSLLLQPTSTTKTQTGPTPTASLVVIWDVPPVSGQPFYDLYAVKAGFKSSLDNKCGDLVLGITPNGHYDDPKQGRIDKIRAKGHSAVRQAPGSLGTFSVGRSGKTALKNCKYVENALNSATFQCDGTGVFKCSVPDHNLAMDISKDNGRCSGTENVRTLVMVCPYY